MTREHKGAGRTLAALKSIRDARRWARRENAGLCFTPVSASRANPIGAQSGPLHTFVMGGSYHPDHTVLARRLQDYLRWRKAA